MGPINCAPNPSEAKRLVGAKRLGGKRPGGKRLWGETTRGGNGLRAKRPGFQHKQLLGTKFIHSVVPNLEY